MPAVLEAVDLAALLAEACAWALLTILVILLAKLISVLHFNIDLGIVSFEPLGWLADALSSYVLTGAEDARQAVAGAMKATYDGLVWSFDEMLGLFVDIGHATRALALYLWQHVVQPFVHAIVNPIRTALTKAEAEVASLTKTVATNLTKAETYARTEATSAVTRAEAFTKTEVKTVRNDFTRADALIDARLDGIGTQAEAIAVGVEAAPGIVWGELKSHLDVRNLADATILGVLGALGIHTLTDATGLNSSDCQQNQKQVCGANPAQWLKMIEGLALLGVGLSFDELYKFAESLAGEASGVIEKLA